MANALLMGGEQSGAELTLKGGPPALRVIPSRVPDRGRDVLGVIYPMRLYGDGAPRWAFDRWDGPHYRRTRHVTTEGLTIYEFAGEG